MSDIAIKVENISKMYRLGSAGSGTLVSDVNRWVAQLRGKEDPTKKVGQINDRTQKSSSSEFVWSLRDIDFEIKKGEAVGIIGKNGAGKSTLLKVLSRITTPTSGVVKMNGRVTSLLEVGTGFHPELTGKENIFMNGAIMGMTKQEIKKRFDEIVDFSGCDLYIDTPVKRYSSGMYVRLAFAVAAHLEPEILIVDEVLAVGDAEFQKKCLGKMNQVSKDEGRTVLFVSHNMNSIRSLCKKGIMLKNGTLVADADIESVIHYYEQDQILSSAMRIAELKNREGNGLLRFTDIKFFDKNNEERIDFFVGESLTIEVSFETMPDFFQGNASRIDIDINDRLNNRITWMSSSIYMDKITNGTNKIIFQIDKLLLSQGSYNFNLYGRNNLGVSDWIQNVSRINVINNDYYGTGKKVPDANVSLVTEFSVK